jgi:hypothetical protein
MARRLRALSPGMRERESRERTLYCWLNQAMSFSKAATRSSPVFWNDLSAVSAACALVSFRIGRSAGSFALYRIQS